MNVASTVGYCSSKMHLYQMTFSSRYWRSSANIDLSKSIVDRFFSSEYIHLIRARNSNEECRVKVTLPIEMVIHVFCCLSRRSHLWVSILLEIPTRISIVFFRRVYPQFKNIVNRWKNSNWNVSIRFVWIDVFQAFMILICARYETYSNSTRSVSTERIISRTKKQPANWRH